MNRKVLAGLVAMVLTGACTSSDPERTNPGGVAERRPVADSEVPDCGNIGEQLRRARRGFVKGRSPDISLLPREPNYIGSAAKPVHTGPWDFLADVPLLVYGPGVVEGRGEVDDVATMADVAPTIAELIDHPFEAPDGVPLDVQETGEVPRLVLTVVWDGGGWNTLREHEGRWPVLARLMEQGTVFTDFEIGSTPSNTPPIHTTLGTGAFPRTHGIAAVKMEIASGDYVDPYEGNRATYLEIPTLADVYDRTERNRPLVGVVATVNWHLGMIGYGAAFDGGDRDIALLMNDAGESYGDSATYDVPPVGGASLQAETDRLDASDGARDGGWKDRDLTDVAIRYASPAYVAFQEKALLDLIATKGFGDDGVADLLFTNFKSIDDAGHRWGMTSEETGAVLEATDRSLGRIVKGLDRVVGRDSWVLLLTADHGQNVYPSESGGWPIAGGELKDDANRALDEERNSTDLVTRVTSAGAYVDDREARRNGLTMRAIAEWMSQYSVGENLREGEKLPRRWAGRHDERLMDAAVVGSGEALLACVRAGT